MKALHVIAFVLLVVGGLNWLLVAFNWNLVDAVLGVGSMLAKIVYVLVGLSAVYLAFSHKGSCKDCSCAPTTAPQM
jgi:hypothetical protein